MDCPKKDCDGKVEAWFEDVAWCGVDDETGEPMYDFPAPSEMNFKYYQCSQCCQKWTNKDHLLMDSFCKDVVAEKLKRGLEGCVKAIKKGGEINR